MPSASKLPEMLKEYVSLLIGLYKNNGSVSYVDNFFSISTDFTLLKLSFF